MSCGGPLTNGKEEKMHGLISDIGYINYTWFLSGAYPQATPAPSQEVATLPTPITREKKPTTPTPTEVLTYTLCIDSPDLTSHTTTLNFASVNRPIS